MYTSEEEPMKCHIIIGENEAFGLSTLQMTTVVSAFQVPGDGTIWFQIEGCKEPSDFDDMSMQDLRTIANELSNLNERSDLWS